MDIERLSWMREELRKLVIATEEMIQDKAGHTAEPEAFEADDQTNPVSTDERQISYEEVAALGVAIYNAHGRSALTKFVGEMGVDNLRRLAKEQYAAALERGHQILEGGPDA